MKNQNQGRAHAHLWFAYVLAFALLVSCSEDAPSPLPSGYFRIDLEPPVYVRKELDCPFVFEISDRSRLDIFSSGLQGQNCWFDLYYPRFKARVHFTYKDLDGNLREYIEESRAMVYEHTIKASKIQSLTISNDNKNVYGLLYSLEGNVASPFQFYLTDSTSHFMRGSLYFEAKPNQDSIGPVLDYVKTDLNHLIESFEWR